MNDRDLSNGQTLPGTKSAKRVLLVVDDEPSVCRLLSRRLESSFDALYSATTPTDAEKRLEQGDISHLICDFNLGEDVPKGMDLIVKWRDEYPSIKRAVLYTSSDIFDMIKPSGVDEIIPKTTDFGELMEALNP